MAAPSVPLSILLAKDVPCEWHDGVGLIAQLLEQLRPIGGAQPHTIPDLGSIALESTGWLTVSPQPERELPIMPGAAQLLQEVLSGIDQPPQLRLYAMQTAGNGADTPLAQFADELSKWERPNRIPKLIALHGRAVEKIGLAALTEEAVARQKVQAMRLRERSRSGPERKRDRKNVAASSSSPTRTTVIGAGLVLAAGLVATLEWRYVVGHMTPPPSTTAAEVADEDAPDTSSTNTAPAGAGTSPTIRRPAPRTVPPAPSAPTEPMAETPVSAAEVELARAQQLFEQQNYLNARTAFERVLDSLSGSSSPQAEEIRQTARSLDEVARAAVEATALAALEFRSGDPGVTPPVAEAYLPPKPDPRTPPDKLQVMELRINAEGNVDSAKFVINRPTYRNAWWPAAAKAWHFKPAMKDGRPVRFVMRIVVDDSDTGR